MITTPEITFGSLAYTDPETLLNCFNGSFKDYFVPMHLTREILADKLYAEAIDLKLSYGAFHDNKLVAFILNGIDTIDNKLTAYNAGTGVLPEYRGKNLAYSLYEFCIHHLKNNGIRKSVLEVFIQNTQAIKTYERTGFSATRKMISYKGEPALRKGERVNIETYQQPDWEIIEEMREWQPAWQYNNNTLKRAWNNYSLFIAYKENIAVAYCIVNLRNGRIANFGSKNKNAEYLTSLFSYVAEAIENPLSVVHVDEKAVEANSFLRATGMKHLVTSYEMEKDL